MSFVGERGTLRSGSRFAQRNTAYYSTVRELKLRHKRLFDPEPAVSHRSVFVPGSRRTSGIITQTIIRSTLDSPLLEETIRQTFLELFAEGDIEQSPNQLYEVVITFNCILENRDASSYSVFYGIDHRYVYIFTLLIPLKKIKMKLYICFCSVHKKMVFFLQRNQYWRSSCGTSS